MQDLALSGLVVAPVARQLSAWLEAGKLDEDVLDVALTPDARSILDAPSEGMGWVPLADLESMVVVLADQLGGGTGLVEWVEAILPVWATNVPIASLRSDACALVDGPGFVVTQASERLLRGSSWRYDGGREWFAVRLLGLESASADLMTIVGALLARGAEGVAEGFDDLRFDGVGSTELCVFGEKQGSNALEHTDAERAHPAVLVA